MCQIAVKCGTGMKGIKHAVGGTKSFHEPKIGTRKGCQTQEENKEDEKTEYQYFGKIEVPEQEVQQRM